MASTKPGTMLLGGVMVSATPRTFTQLSVRARERLLLKWAGSRVELLQMVRGRL